MNEEFKIVWQNMKNRKMRSWLTIIGILIGIAAVVSLIGLGQGFNEAITEQFEEIGGDKVLITPADADFGLPSDVSKMSERDKNVVESVVGVRTVAAMSYSVGTVEWDDITQFYGVYDVGEGEERDLIASMMGVDVIEGRLLDDGDRFKAVIGFDYSRDDVFDKPLRVGDSFELNGHTFTAVGRLDKIGNSIDDRQLGIPSDTFREVFERERGESDYLIAQILDPERSDEIVDSIKRKLRKSRGEKEGEETFAVQSFGDLLESFNNVFSIVRVVIIGIAAISLLVGGIGIANTMYTSILERTREIGVMKAVGADKKNIILIFMIEAGLLGLVGGILGAAIGAGFALLVAYVGGVLYGSPLIKADISFWLVFGSILFSFIIGCVSGIVPSIQAAKLDPVEALRYE